MRMADILFSQGFGSRRECVSLLARGVVRVSGQVVQQPDDDFQTEGLVFEVEGTTWPFMAKALVLLNKPAGFECSREPRDHPSVLSLLPLPLQRRVQPVGRLDQDTTGLLLLTDDGVLLHRLTSPKHHVHKVYEVHTHHPVSDELVTQLLLGVVLKDDPKPAKALSCVATGPHAIRLSVSEGRYHQVKRMVAAAGNRVARLHRSGFGALQLGNRLAEGQWRWVTGAETALLSAAPPAARPDAAG